MFNIYRYEGKTKEECLNKCLTELDKSENELLLVENEIEGKLFKAKKFELEVVIKDEIITAIKNFIKELGSLMNIEINSEVREKEGIYNIVLISENNNILIGKDGKTLNAIQLILKQTLNLKNHFGIKINIDVSDYKSRKKRNLEYEIRKIAQEVIRTKIDVKLDPMTSFDRRVVHTVISEYEELVSESFGEGFERHVVISHKEG